MKTITKFAAATLLAISFAAPALAAEPEALTLQERNAYAQQTQQPVNRAAVYRAADAYAFAPAGTEAASHDLGIASQR